MSEELHAELVPAEEPVPAPLPASELDTLIQTAKQYPRSIGTFLKRAQTLATLNKTIAEQCVYAIPRGGKTIRGPSVRAAEILAATYGNLRVWTRVAEVGTHVSVIGTAWDLESNVAVQVEVRRRLTDRDGRPFNDDMTQLTINAASAIARRNAIFAVIPRAYTEEVMAAVVRLLAGDGQPFEDRREAMLQWFEQRGVTRQQVLNALGVPTEEDITVEHLVDLRGLRNAVEEEGAEAVFSTPPTTQQQPNTIADKATKAAKTVKQSMSGEELPLE